MFLVKFAECLSQMIKKVLIPFSLFALLLYPQDGLADLTDDLDELDPKNPSSEPPAGSNPAPKKGSEKKQSPSSPRQPRTIKQPADQVPRNNEGSKPAADKRSSRSKERNKPLNKKPSPLEEKKHPVIFEGDQLSGIKRLGTIELHQNVKVNQGDFNLEAKNAKVFFDKATDEVDKVIAKGSVKMSKVDPQTGEMIRAYSQIAEFDAVNQKVELIEKAELIRGEDVIRGQVIIYDLKTGQLKASKVKGVVKPQENQEAGSREN